MNKSNIPLLVLFTAFLFACNNQKPQQQKEKSTCFEFMSSEQNKDFCDTTVLSNGAKLYYLWNCDSTCLVFENDKKVILKSSNELDPILFSKTGLNFLKEYPNYLLFCHYWISGCCVPPDIVFLDKETGTEMKRISNDLFVWGDVDENYAVYFRDSSLTELIYLDHSTDKEHQIHFKQNEILTSIKANGSIFTADLFNNFKKNKTELTFDLKVTKERVEKLKFSIN